jgi:hypothetical protein
VVSEIGDEGDEIGGEVETRGFGIKPDSTAFSFWQQKSL